MEKLIINNIVNNIQILLKFWGLNVETLSKKIGLSSSGIYKILQGNTFKIDALIKIAHGLYVNPHVLLSPTILPKRYIEEGEDVVKILYTPTKGMFGILDDDEPRPIKIYCVVNDESSLEPLNQFKAKVNELEDKNKSQLLEIERKDTLIDFLNEQIDFYKEKAAEYKTFNAQLMNAALDEIIKKDSEK